MAGKFPNGKLIWVKEPSVVQSLFERRKPRCHVAGSRFTDLGSLPSLIQKRFNTKLFSANGPPLI
jgi:hypothetical protein